LPLCVDLGVWRGFPRDPLSRPVFHDFGPDGDAAAKRRADPQLRNRPVGSGFFQIIHGVGELLKIAPERVDSVSRPVDRHAPSNEGVAIRPQLHG
jgi:hypothetical protein